MSLTSCSCRLRDEVTPDDAGHVRRIVRDSGFFTPEEEDVAVELVMERLVRGPASGYDFVMVEEEDTLLGYACFGPTPATEGIYDLYWIVVSPACQCKGVGTFLVDQVIKKVKAAGGRTLYADTSGQQKYEPTRRFYRKCGFVAEARLRDFYRPGDDKVVYRRDL